MLRIDWNFPGVQVTESGLTAQVKTGELHIAHMGCMLVATTVPKKQEFPEQHEATCDFLDRQYGSRKSWKSSAKATELLGRSLLSLARAAGAKGIQLIDTMRSGSDYWRPGKLLTDSVETMRRLAIGHSEVSVAYSRLDELCPSIDLLTRFRNDGSMTFGQYAQQYALELRGNGGLELAIAEVVKLNSRNWVPVFYCTDPYVKGYCRSADCLRVPYVSRRWQDKLRDTGCHRVILVEEIIRQIVEQRFNVRLFELDQLDEKGVHIRLHNPQKKAY